MSAFEVGVGALESIVQQRNQAHAPLQSCIFGAGTRAVSASAICASIRLRTWLFQLSAFIFLSPARHETAVFGQLCVHQYGRTPASPSVSGAST